MKYATFCSGIGAPEVAWAGLPDWECIAQAEYAAFPSAVLAERFPGVPNLRDLTAPNFVDRLAAIGLPDLVCAGIPCQPFSVAGLKLGTNDPRNLTSRFVEIANAVDDLRLAAGLDPAWWLVENVPGLLSDVDALGSLLAGLCGCDAALADPGGGSWTSAGVVAGPRRVVAWRVLDAQFFGVPQRRRRVFILARGGAGGWRVADALLPIAARVRRDPAAGGAARQGVADFSPQGITHSLRASGGGEDGTGRMPPIVTGTVTSRTCRSVGADDAANGHLVPIAFGAQMSTPQVDNDLSQTLQAKNPQGVDVFSAEGGPVNLSASNLAKQGNNQQPLCATAATVRRLTPVECERLQGFPDGHTAVTYRGKPAADGPRYHAIGNSMAVPVMRYIGERIEAVR